MKVFEPTLSNSTTSTDSDEEQFTDLDFELVEPAACKEGRREKHDRWNTGTASLIEIESVEAASAGRSSIWHYATSFSGFDMSFLLGQLLSIALAANGAASEAFHFSYDASVPTFQSFCMYLLLGLIHFPYWISRKHQERQTSNGNLSEVNEESRGHERDESGAIETQPKQHLFLNIQSLALHSFSWKYYALMAFLHVQANFCLLKAYEYISLKTVSLLDSLAIPAAMIASRVFLGRKYTWLHAVAACICILGSFVTVVNDYREGGRIMKGDDNDNSMLFSNSTSTDDYDNRETMSVDSSPEMLHSHSLLGDFLAIMGAILTGVNDVFAEEIVRDSGSCVEYLAMLGFFGAAISFVQVLVLERSDVSNLFLLGSYVQWLLLALSAVAGYIFFGGMSRFLLLSESALLNLSLLSGDLWAVVFSVIEEHVMPTYIFFISFAIIVSGVVVYEMAPSPIVNEDEEHESEKNEASLYREPKDDLHLTIV